MLMTVTRTNPLLTRLDEVERVRSLSARAWSLAAGLSESYVKQIRLRAIGSESYALPEKHAPALARAAGVRVAWLRHGLGPRDGDDQPEPLPAATPLVVRGPRDVDVALLRAYREGRHTEADVLAALALMSTGESMLPDDPQRALTVAKNILAAIARLRRDGKEISYQNLSWSLAEGAADAANAEGLAQLRALGGEPPREPVRTPARGVPAVPLAPKPRND